MIRRIRFVVCAVLFFQSLFFISGCSNNKNTGKEITFMLWGTPDELKYTRKFIVDEFTKENPDISVKLYEQSGLDKYNDKLLTMVVGGTPPDVVLVPNWLFPSYVERDLLLDLGPYIQKDKVDIKEYCDVYTNDYKHNGSYYGMPIMGSPHVLYYNVDMFDKYGVKYPNSNWKWKDLLESAKKLTKDLNGDGKTDIYGLQVASYQWSLFMSQNGGDVYNKTGTEFVIGTPKNLEQNTEALQFFIDLSEKHKVSPNYIEKQTLSSGGSTPLFQSQRAAMLITPAWFRGVLKDAKFRWQIAPLPYQKQRAAGFIDYGLVVFKNTKYSDAAWKLVKALTGDKMQAIIAKSCRDAVPKKSVLFSDVFLKPDMLPKDINNNVFLEATKYDEHMSIPRGELAFSIKEVGDIVTREIDLIYIQKNDVKQTLISIQKAVDKLLQSKKDK